MCISVHKVINKVSKWQRSALSKLKKIFVTPQHDYKISTELFGQFDANKVAKELDLEKKGAAKGCRE